MLTLDEAIKHCEEKAEEQRERIITVLNDVCEVYDPDCEKCAEEYEQLAEWLKELKGLKENSSAQDFKSEIFRMVNMGVYPEAIIEWVREQM